MKRVWVGFISVLFTSQICAEVLRLSEPVAKDAQTETFGVKLDASLPKVSMQDLVVDASSYLTQAFQVETRIAKVCQKKGCFFIAQQDQHILRVSFRDYGFFIPTDSSGKIVTIAGELVQKDVSPKQAAHFKADLKSDDNEDGGTVKAGLVYEIVADSVKIPLSD